MGNFRALSKGYDTDAKTGEASILLGSIYYLSRRLTESPLVKEPWICEGNEQKLAHLVKKNYPDYLNCAPPSN